MTKMNFTNDQKAFEYVLYMMAASYFDKTVCASGLTERNMLLQFKEQKLSSQYLMEDICIDFLEGLVDHLPAHFFNRKMIVKLNRLASGLTEIVFVDARNILAFQAIYAGKKFQIRCQVWGKRTGKNGFKEDGGEQK